MKDAFLYTFLKVTVESAGLELSYTLGLGQQGSLLLSPGISWLWCLCYCYYIVPQVDTSNLSSWYFSLSFSGPWCVWRTERRAREHEKAAQSTKKDARTAGTTQSATRPSGGTAGHAAKRWTSHSSDGWHWCGKLIYFMLLEVRIVSIFIDIVFALQLLQRLLEVCLEGALPQSSMMNSTILSSAFITNCMILRYIHMHT